MEENETVESSPSWLQRLKKESWEAELLVSAVAIFAILKSFAGLDWLIIKFIDRLDPSQYDIGYFILVFGYLAIGILAAMFAIHFALRAYWIGLVGLNSVFPDYGLEDSAYSPIYTKKILKVLPKVSQSITKTDELCSVIFSAAFALMLIYLYGTIFSSLYLILFNVLKDFVPAWVLLIPIGVLAFILIFGMLISIPANMKKFHGNKTIQHLYFIYVRWGSLLIYGPIYKSILQITMLFGSNFKKKKGLIKMVLLMLLIGVIFGMIKLIDSDYRYLIVHKEMQDHTKLEPSLYATNNSEKTFLLTPEINSDIQTGRAIKVFIPIFNHEIDLFKKACGITASDKIGYKEADERNRIRKQYLDCYQKKHKIYVDNKAVQVEFLKTDHPNTDQYGLTGYIDVNNLSPGNHKILVQKTVSGENEKKWTIPFYYSPK